MLPIMALVKLNTYNNNRIENRYWNMHNFAMFYITQICDIFLFL